MQNYKKKSVFTIIFSKFAPNMKQIVLFLVFVVCMSACKESAQKQHKPIKEEIQQELLIEYQQKVASTDSAIMANEQAQAVATTLMEQNMLKVKADSLKARYDAYCAIVRKIKMEQAKE